MEPYLGLICTLAGVTSLLTVAGWLVRREIRRNRTVILLSSLREEVMTRPLSVQKFSPLRSFRISQR